MEGPEAYRLTVGRAGVRIFAATAAGSFYALQTLRDLVLMNGAELPCVEIHDTPDFRRRGVYLDCSRGKVPTVETLKALIECLAAWKINELQLYIENVFTFRRHPQIGKGFSPFTPGQITEIQGCCRLHHIRLVPSLASFGHMERILALPKYAHLGEKPGHHGLPGGTTLCPGDPGSIRLITDLYSEFLPLFESLDFNACCDETWELGQGRSAGLARRSGTGRLYLEFVKKLHTLCVRHGKRMNMWADIVLNHPECLRDLPRDIVMLNWDYSPKGTRIPMTRKLSDAGLSFMVCPGTSGWRSHGTRLHNAIENVAVFATEGLRQGADGILMTDWGDHGHRNPLGASLHGFAHAAAHAWNHDGVNDSSFTRLFCRRFLEQSNDQLADFIEALGQSEPLTGAGLYYVIGESLDGESDLFRSIPRISPVWIPPTHRISQISRASVDGCEQALSILGEKGAARLFDMPAGAFARRAIEDLLLSAEMDTLACRKTLLAHRIRAGRQLPPRQLRRLASDIEQFSPHFEANWLQRCKPSRLRDNLRLFQNAATECSTLL
jgi:hypothetical protein